MDNTTTNIITDTLVSTTTNTENLTQTILDTINNIFNNLFSSIDNSMYAILDDLAFINTDILNDTFFEKIFGTNSSNGLLLIANSLFIGFALYYCFKLLYSNFVSIQIESPYQFIFKLLIMGIAINCSYFICSKIIEINSLISSAIREIGKNIFNQNISFSNLIQNLNSVISVEKNTFNLFSFDGLLKSFVSVSLFNLLFSYALRYIMVKVFVLLAPFSILTLINNSTSWFFKIWLKTILSLLLLQSLISIILLIIFSFKLNFTDVFSKLMCIGSIYALIRANSYMQHFFGGISTDISNNINFMKNTMK